jgi:hypothetical protein
LDYILNQKVYLNILSKEQLEILPVIQHFHKDYVLVGGTAIALLLGHRESIDFDLFTFKNKNQFKTAEELSKVSAFPFSKIRELKDQAHFNINGVKLTFFNFPYKIPSQILFKEIKSPDLLTLAAMKAFALGGRAKWKDYVDLYFIIKHGVKLKNIIQKTEELFNSERATVFSERIFLEQLTYYKDVSYEEEVSYLIPDAPTNSEIEAELKRIAFEFLENN